MKSFSQFIVEEQPNANRPGDKKPSIQGNETLEPTLSDFEQTTKELPLGTVLMVRQTQNPDPELKLNIQRPPQLIQTSPSSIKTFHIVKDEEHYWHEIKNFQQQGKTFKGEVKPSKFSTDGIIGAQEVSKGIKKTGDKITTIFQLAVLPDRSVIEFPHHLLNSKPELYQKMNGLWYKPENTKGYDSIFFDSILDYGNCVWKA